MSFFEPYVAMWKNYVNFSCRTTRRGYWMAVLGNVIVGIVLSILVGIAGDALAFLPGLYSLAAFLPGLGIFIRRLQDAGKPWYFMFASLIPIAGPIWVLIVLCQDSVAPDGRPVV